MILPGKREKVNESLEKGGKRQGRPEAKQRKVMKKERAL